MIPIREAARELGVTPRQLLKYVLGNRIFASLELDGHIRIPRREFEIMKENRVNISWPPHFTNP